MHTSRLHREVAILLAGLLCNALLVAQTSPRQYRGRPSSAHSATAASVEPPPPPLQPNWPINDQPTPASVKWDSTGLHIAAANSSLQQILSEVTAATSTKLEGFNKDERVFGTFGPGQPRDVLSQLLQGSGYNIVMIGDQGRGAPREIVLSARSTGAAPQAGAHPSQDDNEDDYDNQIEVQPPQPAQPMQQVPPQQPQPAGRMGIGPDGTPRTPQQIQQELIQRQQQILQQQQMQQQGNPPQN